MKKVRDYLVRFHNERGNEISLPYRSTDGVRAVRTGQGLAIRHGCVSDKFIIIHLKSGAAIYAGPALGSSSRSHNRGKVKTASSKR